MTASATIAALQTPPGAGGIAVILLWGDEAGRILQEVFRPRKGHDAGGPGVLQLGRLVDGEAVIDEAVSHWDGRSAEINIHGGPAAARAALDLLRRRGATVQAGQDAVHGPAPGHPRWDNPAIGRELLQVLPQARSLLVVAALSRQWSGGISESARGILESGTDSGPAAEKLRRAAAGLARMRRLLAPAEVVLAGPPNAGKSTLANVLVGRPVSLVHEQPGTTRDWVRELALLDGVPVWITDTAGLWETEQSLGQVDREAAARARQRAQQADLVLLLAPGGPLRVPAWLGGAAVLRVASQCDACPPRAADVAVSAQTGAGLAELRRRILGALDLLDMDTAAPMAFTERQARLLLAAAEALDAGDRTAATVSLNSLLAGP